MSEVVKAEVTEKVELMDAMDMDLDSVDLEELSGLDDVDLSDFGEVNEVMEFPHVKIPTKDFKEFLKVAKKVSSSGGKDIISKAVCMQAVGDQLVCRATDFDVYVMRKLKMLNTENVFSKPIIIPTDILIKLTNAVPVNTIIYEKEGTMYMRLYGGDINLETYTMDIDKFTFTDAVAANGKVGVEDLYAVMKDFSTVVTAAVSPTERRITCDKTGAYASYMFAILVANKSLTNFDLKVKDLDVLKTLTVNKKDEDIEVFLTTPEVKVNRCLLKGSDFEYAFLLSDNTLSETMKNNISTIVGDTGVFVDFIQFYKMIEVASELPYAIGKVGINYSEEGIKVNIMTKKGTDNIFDIPGHVQGTPVALKAELVVQAKLLKIILRSFATKTSVRLSVCDKGFGIQADDYSAAIYAEIK